MARKREKRPSLRLPAAVLLLTLALTGGHSLLTPKVDAQSAATPAPTPSAPLEAVRPQAAKRPLPAPEPTPEPAPAPYDCSAPVPLSDPAPEDWFSDAAFLGDSLTDGLLLYGGVSGAKNLAYKGLMVDSAQTKAFVKSPSGKVTALDALGQGDYGKVYLLLGVNELGWYNDARFYKTYAELVDKVRAARPGAQIYLQQLLPVTAEQSATHDYINNEKIAVYNDLIARLAEEKEVYLLSPGAALADETGALPAEGSTDGVHLTKAYYQLWREYLETHIVP